MEFEIDEKLVEVVSIGLTAISTFVAILQFLFAIRERARQERGAGMGSVGGLFALSLMFAGVGLLFAYVVINPGIAEPIIDKLNPSKPSKAPPPPPGPSPKPPTPRPETSPTSDLSGQEMLNYLVHPSTIGARWITLAEKIRHHSIIEPVENLDPPGEILQHITIANCALVVSVDVSGNVSRIASQPTNECLAAWERVVPQFVSESAAGSGNYSLANARQTSSTEQIKPIKLKEFIQSSSIPDVVGINGRLDNAYQSRDSRYIEIVTQLTGSESDPYKSVIQRKSDEFGPLAIVRTRFSNTQSQPDFQYISRKLRSSIVQGRRVNGKCNTDYIDKIIREIGEQEIEEIELRSFDARLLCPQ